MITELVTIETDTAQPLDGAWYEPDGGATAGTVLLFHGNTMNFYVGAPRFLPPALTELGFACLAFNRRGHDILSNRNSRAVEGAAFQTTAEAIADNEFAARWVAAEHGSTKGADAPVIIGHSNGGFLGVQHVANHPETPALVLLSAHAGGDVAAALAPTTGLLGGARTEEILQQAEAMVADGRGDELMLVPGWWYVITARSYLDRLTTMPNTVETAPRITCPTLYIRGDQEIRDSYPAEDFAAASAGPCDVEIVENCDHYYNDREDAIADLVAGWLKKALIDG
ncbi:MAG: alpha/beta fold hydrolase [Rhodospirillaceae bacterium]|jgi:pimeloyl-ACP methyl ester carboxylesterase|nr:alpha/beta fold hydrolase [Rhodospirillaceae bacterium]MBT5944069.1 alpha/beta fold hydrolase [Rhodospirillaceae bacterium]MBT6402986.1 alpha/beta fold hydrolase [Rhodospirillaceae bacterium]MBT6537630.1 alpha/beta fold hydrolase [Rhodospirillaceae bacterium]MBT7360551.1 alpha/beta fold hydrolase [Rhodospirillaceae bacterium]